jgi:hypothetical protein
MTIKYFLVLFFFGFINLVSAQDKPTFSDQQFKLSIGPVKGQPGFFETFTWSQGFGATLEYNNHFSKRFSWGCELGFTFDYDYRQSNRFAIYITDDGTINIGNTEGYYDYTRNQFSIIPQISYHIVNRPKFNVCLTGGFGLYSVKTSHYSLTPNSLLLGGFHHTSLFPLYYVGNLALSFDYKISPHVFAGLKVQDHIVGDFEFRSLRVSLGYIIDAVSP